MPTPPAPSQESAVAEQVLDQVNIPTLPEAAVKLLAMCRDEFVGAGELVRVIELDSALSARLLKVANSAAFGQSGRVSTLTRAAIVLGNENLKVAALGFHLANAWCDVGAEGFALREFWRDSVIRACLARRLAQAVGHHPREEAFLLGMLQNIGALILATHFGPGYQEAIRGCRGDGGEQQAVERAHFGTDHAEVAGTLALRWNFPDPLVQAISRQCAEPAYFHTQDPAELLWQIAYFAAAVPFAPDRQTAKLGAHLRNLAFSAFVLSMEGLGEVFTDTVEQFNALHGVFAHMVPKDGHVENLMQEARTLIASLGTEFNEDPADEA